MLLCHVKRWTKIGSKYNTVHEDMLSKASNSTLLHFLYFVSLLLLFLPFRLSSGLCLCCIPLCEMFCVMCFWDSSSHLQLTVLSLSLSLSLSLFLSLSRMHACVCVFSCAYTHASYAGVFVAEKNALKLILMSAKTKQMVFLQPSENTKRCGNELLEDSHVVAER